MATRRKTKKKAAKKTPRSRKKKVASKKTSTRLNLCIDPELRDAIKAYAKRKHTTVTQIIIDNFVDRLEAEKDIGVKSV